MNLQQISSPVGSIIAYAGKIDKPNNPIEAMGWMVCDGQRLSTRQYPELFAVLGYLYGGNDDFFNIPDYRGQFLRGVSTDPGSTESRRQTADGSYSGVGTTQADALQLHQHQYSAPVPGMPSGNMGTTYSNINPDAYTGNPTNDRNTNEVRTSDYETRPVNTFVYYLIKYTYGLGRL